MFDIIRSTRSIFDDFFNDFPTTTKGLMTTDIKERSNSYIFEVDLPGFNKDDIKVSIKNNYLTIEAKKEKETENKDENILGEKDNSVHTEEVIMLKCWNGRFKC